MDGVEFNGKLRCAEKGVASRVHAATTSVAQREDQSDIDQPFKEERHLLSAARARVRFYFNITSLLYRTRPVLEWLLWKTTFPSLLIPIL